jgi:hypothetical protein
MEVKGDRQKNRKDMKKKKKKKWMKINTFTNKSRKFVVQD